MAEVDYTLKNIEKCQCPPCPVQAESDCAKRQDSELQEVLRRNEGGMPDPRIVPGLYCSTGKSPCTDLNFRQTCFCPLCEIWKEYGLASTYYCQKGSAEEIG